jgi:putative peptidoglycan lipid II flippase
MRFDDRLRQSALKLGLAGVAMTAALWLMVAPVARFFGGWMARDLVTLAVLAAIGGMFYAGVVLAIFGRGWLAAFRARSR